MNKFLAAFWYISAFISFVIICLEFYTRGTINRLYITDMIASLALARTYKLEAEQ